MLKKKQEQAQQTVQTESSNKQVKRISIMQSKLTTRILILVLFIALFSSLSFAWFSGIHIGFNDLNLSTLSSLKNNVEVIGYSFNEEYDENDENSKYLINSNFKTNKEMDSEGDATSKNLFAGDYFEPGAINKINQSSYSTVEAYNAAVNAAIDANTNTKYIKITNKSDLAIAVRTLFSTAEVDTDINDLSGFWYLITDVTTEVNAVEQETFIDKLSTYAANNKASRNNEFNETNLQSNLFGTLTSKVLLGTIDEPEDREVGITKVYRIDYGLCEAALRSSGAYYFGKKVKMNVFIYYGQVNAPEGDDTPVETAIREVDSAEKLISTLSNLKEAFNGDTIKFTADITIDGPLTITRPFNFDLNGHSLIINGGDLKFNYNSSTPVTVNCAGGGKIHIIGKRAATSAQTAYDGSLIINTPNSPITFIGDNASSFGEEYYDLRLDGVGSIINYSKNSCGGLSLEKMYIIQKTYNTYNPSQLDKADTKVTLQDEAYVHIGEFMRVDVITSDDIQSCYIYNEGKVGIIYLPSVHIPVNAQANHYYVTITNNGQIGGEGEEGYNGPIPATWDVQVPSNARKETTYVVKQAKSNNFSIGGSNSFSENDVVDETTPSTYVVPIPNEEDSYYVYLSSTTPKQDVSGHTELGSSMLRYAMLSYFNQNLSNLAGIKKLVIIGSKGVYMDEYDFKFLTQKEDGIYIFTYLEHLDLSGISTKTLTDGYTTQTLNRIPSNALNGKASLKTVILPEDTIYVGKNAFSGTSITKITIPSNVIKVESGAFSTVIDVKITSTFVLPNNDFLPGFTKEIAYFFVDSTVVDKFKNQFNATYNKYTCIYEQYDYYKHVYRYAEHIDNNFYIRVTSETKSQIEIVAYTGDIYGINVSPSVLEYLGQSYTVIGIGRDAYINMTSNQNITLALTLGDSVSYVGKEAFINLKYISTLNTSLATSIEDRAFYGCIGMNKLIVNGEAVLGNEAFAGCTSLWNVSLSKCIELKDRVFAGDTKIRELSIPKVRKLGSQVFANCYLFEKVVFGELDSIADYTFQNCTHLETVIISNSTYSIGDYCFQNCSSLYAIGSSSSDLVNGYINLASITSIGDYAFSGCRSIKYIIAPELTDIGYAAFSQEKKYKEDSSQFCSSLEYIKAEKVENIGDYAFYKLTNLQFAEIDAAKIIGNYAFYATKLQYIDIPKATNIGAFAFYDCSSIYEISFGKPTYIGASAFINVNPAYIDVSEFSYPSNLSIPDDPDVETYAFGGNNDWHRFDSTVKYYYKVGVSETDPNYESTAAERKYYLFKVLETSYYKEWSDWYNGYYTDYRDNIHVDYLFMKDQFCGDWILHSVDNIVSKNLYLYNIDITKIVEGDTTRYEGEILSYHGKPLVGNVVIPCLEYYANGISNADFNDKDNLIIDEGQDIDYYSGTFKLQVDDGLKDVLITKIGYYAYENVNGIATEESAKKTGDSYCHISFARTVKIIEEGAFRYSKIDYLDLNKVEIIESDAFRNTSELRYVDLGNVVEIGDYAFSSYNGSRTLWEMYTQYSTNFSIANSQFTNSILTKVVFRHVDKLGEGSFFFNFLSKNAFLILDFKLNAPGLDASYNKGYGAGDRYNIPSDVHEIWRGYNNNLKYYYNNSYETDYNDINIVAPYVDSEDESFVQSQFLKIIDSNHLFFDYGYTYMPNYKVNNVEVGMFWLKPGNMSDPSSGFIIQKSLIRNFGDDLTIEGISVVNLATKRYMYTIPTSLNGENIYSSWTSSTMTAGQTYQAKISAQSFKNSTVKSGFIFDLMIGDGITNIPSNAFRFAQFKNVYLNDVKVLEESAFAYSSVTNVYGFNVESIGSSAFYYSSISIIDLRQNKKLNENTGKYETIYVSFNSNFLLNSSIQSIYVNDSDLDGYIERTKGTTINSSYYNGSYGVELYVFIKAVGTYIGEVKINYNSSFDIDSILATYEADETESIEWIIEDDTDNKFSIVEGVVSVNDNEEVGVGKYTDGRCDVYCIKHKDGQADQVIGKFRFIISEEATSSEYYNITKSTIVNKDSLNHNFYGYRVINYKGQTLSGTFDVGEAFHTFMYNNLDPEDLTRYGYIFNIKNPETNEFTLVELSVGSYMNLKINNQSSVNLYTGKYITKIDDYAFYSVPLVEMWLTNVTYIGRRAFYNSNSINVLLTVVMPKIETIEHQAFYQNMFLQTVVIGDNSTSKLKKIDSQVFAYCTSIKKLGVINIDLSTIDVIDDYLINDLSVSDIPELLWISEITEHINDQEEVSYTYEYYDTVANPNYGFIFLPNSCTSLGYRAFYQLIEIDEVRYPNCPEVTSIAGNLFESCKKLHYVRLGKYVTSIGNEAFAYCENLISTPYPSLTEADIDSFNQYITHDITYFVNPHGVDSPYRTDGIDFTYIKTIGTGSFRNCYQLNNLYLDSIQSIGSEAFMECSSLRYISFELNRPVDGSSKVTFNSRWNYSTHELKRYYVSSSYRSWFTDAVYIYCREKSLIQYGDDNKVILNYITNPLDTNIILGVKLVAYNGEEMISIPKTYTINGNTYNVLTIGSYAFHGYGENTIDTVILPNTVTTVESHAFDGTMFTYYEEESDGGNYSSVEYGSYVFSGNTKLVKATFTRMKSGGDYFYYNCGGLTEMNLQNNYVNNIYYAPILTDAFFTGSPSKAKCSIAPDTNYLFTLPAYLGRIYEDSEKTDVDNLYSVKIDASDNVTILGYIGENSLGEGGTFTIPTAIQIVDMGDTFYTVTKIADGAFKDASVVTRTNLIIGDNITKIGNRAFYNTNFGSITFTGDPHNVEIGEYAFAEMSVLISADISSVNSISNSNNLFYKDNLLQSVQINLATTKIPDSCFAECGNLASLNIGSALLTIGNNAFENCTSLREIRLNNSTSWVDTYYLGSVTSLGNYAFAGCSNLTYLIGFSIKSLGDYCFKNCSRFVNINLDPSLNYIGKGAFYQCTSMTIAQAYATYIPEECYYGCSSITELFINRATNIGAKAFYQCTGLTQIDLGALQTIYDYAFYRCINLASVEMDRVTSIGSYAFYNCAFSGELLLQSASTVGSYAFANNTTLTKVEFESLNYLGSRAFNNDVLITEFNFINNMNANSQPLQPTAASDSLSGIDQNNTNNFFIYCLDSVISSYENCFSNWRHRVFETGSTYEDYSYKSVRIDGEDGIEIVRYLGNGMKGKIVIPEYINGVKVISIGRYAYYNSFKDMSSVTILNTGKYVVKVGRYAFYNYDFETLALPKVRTIETYAFANNDALGYLSLPECVSISEYAFVNNTSLQLIRFYSSLTSIGYRAFYNTESLRSVYFANVSNVNSLSIYNHGAEVFGALNSTDVIIRVPGSVLSVYKGNKLSYYASRIKAGELDDADFSYRVVNENGQDVIEIIAYEGQATTIKISSIINGMRVARILNNAFENSLNLETVEIPDTLMNISSYAFMGNSTIKEVTVYSDDSNKLANPTLFADNKIYFTSYDGILYGLDDVYGLSDRMPTSLVYYPVAKEDITYAIDGNNLPYVSIIYENAFYGNTYLEELTISKYVKYIGENAFAYCPSMLKLYFDNPGGGASCPTLYGTNILTNCNADLKIYILNDSQSTYYNKFISDEYFSFYADKIFTA